MDVRDRLSGFDPLADDVFGDVQSPTPGELWARGTVWQNRKRRGSWAISGLAAALILGVVSLGWVRSIPDLPAASGDAQVTLPDRIFDVPTWLARGIAGEPAVAVCEVARGSWSGRSIQLAAITGSGRYLFLDLPDYAGQGYALAPDGLHVAYWTAGLSSGGALSSDGQEPVTGVAVQDLVAGTTVQHDFSTRHGLAPDGLLWADSQTVLGSHLQVTGGDKDGDSMTWTTYGDEESWSWRLRDDSVSALDLPGDTTIDPFTEARDGVLLLPGDGHYWRVELASGRVTRFALDGPAGVSGAFGSGSYLSADGVLATVGDAGESSRIPNRVRVASIDRTGVSVGPWVVPDSGGTHQVLGWRGPGTLLLTRVHSEAPQRFSIDTMDVKTGEYAELIALPSQNGLGWSWAEGLLTAEVVPGVAPPSPMDPRVLAGGLVAIVLAAGCSLVWWRRRGQP